MKLDSTIVEIGEDVEAFLEEKMVILFNENVPEELKSVAIIHDNKSMDGNVEVGDYFSLGDTSYKVLAVGDKANETLHDLGHCTIKFANPSEGDLPGTIVVEDKEIASFEPGMQLKFYNN